MFEWDFGVVFFAVMDVLLAACVTVHAVLWKRDSRAVIGWVGLAWLAPLMGAIAYICFGINRIQRKAGSLNLRKSWYDAQQAPLTPEDESQVQRFRSTFPNLIGLASAGKAISGNRLMPGNDIRVLVDGDEAYPAMIKAIDEAQQTVTLLSYIFDCDRAGEEFRTALINAHRRGVQVRVLIDDVGSKYSRPNMVRRLVEDGIPTKSFLPTRVRRFFKYANMRNHRKILVVDGRIGFTGGTNIREGHCLNLDPKFPVQCLHFRLEGPVVRQMQQVFAIDWSFAAGEILSGEEWLPSLASIPRAGQVWARGIEHGPDSQFEKLADLIAAALASAERRVRIVTPYFLPNAALIQSLNVAALRGVEVDIYMPRSNNIALVQWASTAQMWQTLEKGCRMHYTADPFDHTKLMVVDDIWTLIGSTNWDPRSLRLNFEFNVECYDPHLAKSCNQVVDRKAKDAREITLEEVNGRSLPVRLRDGLARLFTPYL